VAIGTRPSGTPGRAGQVSSGAPGATTGRGYADEPTTCCRFVSVSHPRSPPSRRIDYQNGSRWSILRQLRHCLFRTRESCFAAEAPAAQRVATGQAYTMNIWHKICYFTSTHRWVCHFGSLGTDWEIRPTEPAMRSRPRAAAWFLVPGLVLSQFSGRIACRCGSEMARARPPRMGTFPETPVSFVFGNVQARSARQNAAFVGVMFPNGWCCWKRRASRGPVRG
jgi:hypothetical protein